MSDDKPSPQKGLKDDDRNLVLVDDDFKDADLDERLWLYWQRNKTTIIAGIIAAFVVVVGMETVTYLRARTLEKERMAYLAASESGSLNAFAQAHAERPLGGVVWLQEADEAYTNGHFEEAAGLYEKAIAALEQTPLGLRARIGQGLSLYKGGNVSSARNALAQVFQAEEALDTQRAEAHYHLAVIALEQGDTELAGTHLDAIGQLAYTNLWAMKAQGIRQQMEALKAPEQS